MNTLPKPFFARELLLKQELSIFTPLEFSRLFDTNSHQTKYFLEEETKRGFLLRLKKGLYALKTDAPSEEKIANRLYQPSYISFEYALYFHNIIPESPYQVTNATTKPTRTFTVTNRVFTYQKIKTAAYTGYKLVRNNKECFLIAEPEKALADYLYFVVLGKKPYNERFNLSKINKIKLKNYAKLYKRAALIEFAKKILP
ncbi:MAG: hypothetical protein ABIJ36_03470 [Patescibacteria group bacterium]